jgi:multiple antibiotic resistance protein
MLELAISSFVTLFVVIDPIGMVPLFMAVVPGTSAALRRKTAFRGTVGASGMLIAAAFAGGFVLDSLGIALSSF